MTAVDRIQVYQNPPASLSPVAGEAARRWAITYLTAAMSAPPTPGPDGRRPALLWRISGVVISSGL